VRLNSLGKKVEVEKTSQMSRRVLIHIEKRIWLLVHGTSENCSKLEPSYSCCCN